jgi:hypothetical protein
MAESNKYELKSKLIYHAPLLGVILVISGLLLLLDQRIKTGWVSVSIPLAIGIVIACYGILKKATYWLVPGLVIMGLGLAMVLIFSKILPINPNDRIGYSLLWNGFIWLVVFLAIKIMTSHLPWWTLFVAFTCGALGYIFLTEQFSLFIFIFYLSVAIGLVFLLWGSFTGKLGLIIPGALMIATGAGVYFGWSNPEQPGGLQKTGIMLVWFSLGWLLITVFSRVMNKRFMWWPLIPGGILLMVGSGLYIGGNPENALGFLSNTGSIGLILLGAYLIFLKFGMKS